MAGNTDICILNYLTAGRGHHPSVMLLQTTVMRWTAASEKGTL